MKGSCLIVDDDVSMCALLTTALRKQQYDVVAASSGEQALELLTSRDFDVLVTDMNMRGLGGLDLCQRVVENRADIPVIVITAFGSMEAAIAAMRAGAYDFISKPVDLDALAFALDRGIAHHRLRTEVKRLQQVVAATRGSSDMIGSSPPMRRVYDLVERVAQTDASVLITGESGTGKELVARALHQRSPRAAKRFVAVDCAAMPDALLESELFGHVKGAFTDARNARTGLFVQADGGTLFLDEIGELSMTLQPKLLRALQERRVRPVGGESEVPFDARVVAATNRDLETAVHDHAFREDLYYRLNVIHIELPPLRARGGDILLLAQHFLERFASSFAKQVRGISKPAAEKLLAYGWPGNVRELSNCIERAVALTRFEEILVEDLPEKVQDFKPTQMVLDSGDPSELVTMDELERRYILRVLEALNGNKSLAAQTLGLDRKTLYRKLQLYGVAVGAPPGKARDGK
jgi:two-component system, NtrC family, response regulator AtoC